jgi:tRNA uridine 5-carboxymethylaminomethyl modification enzyme
MIEYLKNTRAAPCTANKVLETIPSAPINNSVSLFQLLKRPEISLSHILEINTDSGTKYAEEPVEVLSAQIEMEIKYEGYINRLIRHSESLYKMENTLLPSEISYKELDFLSLEAREKLNHHKPGTLGQASRIAGITPSDVTNLMFHLKRTGYLR